MTESVLVTGAAGFIGGHCCRALLDQGWRVVGLDNFDPFYSRALKEQALAELRGRPGFAFVEGDIRDAALVGRLAADNETVVHLAARAGVRPSIQDPQRSTSINPSRTVRLDRLIALIGRALGVEPVVKRLPMEPGDVRSTCADVTKARGLPGYAPGVGIEDGIPRFADWYQATHGSAPRVST